MAELCQFKYTGKSPRELPRWRSGKESACSVGDGFDPWVRKIPWKRKWQPTSVFLPGESHGQRSLVVYSPWGHKESGTTQRLTHTKVLLGYNLPNKEKHYPGTSLVVQWLRLCTSNAGTQVQSLAEELDPTCGN